MSPPITEYSLDISKLSSKLFLLLTLDTRQHVDIIPCGQKPLGTARQRSVDLYKEMTMGSGNLIISVPGTEIIILE